MAFAPVMDARAPTTTSPSKPPAAAVVSVLARAVVSVGAAVVSVGAAVVSVGAAVVVVSSLTAGSQKSHGQQADDEDSDGKDQRFLSSHNEYPQ